MKNIIYLFLAVTFLMSCQDELINLAPVSQVSSDIFYETESDFESALNAAYNGLQQLNHINWKMQEVRSDNAWASREEAGFAIDNFQLETTNTNIAEYWELSYNAIFRANIILEKILGADIIQEQKDVIIGQAKFIRALVYFDLVRSFGDVPLVTGVLTLSESYDVTRTPQSEVYRQISDDLTSAANSLPAVYENNNDVGRVTSGACYSLLGKVLLTAGDISGAKVALEQVIDKNYTLLDNFADIWNIQNQNNNEIIFAIQYSEGTGNGNSFNYIFAPLTLGADVNQGTGLGMARPTADLIRAFEEGDTRMHATLSPYEVNPNTNDTINNAYFRKFLANQLTQDGGQDWTVLRYSDVLLMYAEVLNEEGELAGAIDYLNMVRSRAFNGDGSKLYTTSDINTSEAFNMALLAERRLEFANENQRWFDLLRFNKAEEFLQLEVRREDFRSGIDLVVFETNMNEYQRLYPIPLQEIEKHNNLEPNPGY